MRVLLALGGNAMTNADGRARPEDQIDHAVGFSALAPVGREVGPGAPLGIVHARSDGAAQAAAKALLDAYQLGKKAPETGPTVLARFAAGEDAAGGPIDDSETGDDA